jgi:hypothetical protein
MDDLWLLKFPWPRAPGESPRFELRRQPAGVHVWQSIESELGYAYFIEIPSQEKLAYTATGDEWVQLACTLEVPGASAAVAAGYHYVVETDVLAAHEDDFNAWYDEEHLPGLAAVPGTVRAARYVSAAGSPRYYACYDLASLDTFGSTAWLAVRATAWSARVRRSFRNTHRMMFRRPRAVAEPTS